MSKTKCASVAEARELYRERLEETWFQPQTNETYYPALWSYGEGAGEASTSTHYDQRKSLAAERTMRELAEENDLTIPHEREDWQDMGTGDIARTIAAAINAAYAADNAEEKDEA